MDRRFVAILAGLVIIFVGVFAFTQHSNNKSTGGSSSTSPTNHVMGDDKKGVTLVEYADYQCSACEEFYPAVTQAVAQYSGDITFQFRNLPLTSLHPNAFAAARSAEAAGLQGKFWQMHDQLYNSANWQNWTGASNPQTYFDGYAKAIGLDVNQFNTDYSSEKVNNAINADVSAFKKTGKEMATPTFFLDGKALDNNTLVDSQTGPSADKIGQTIAAEIAKKQ